MGRSGLLNLGASKYYGTHFMKRLRELHRSVAFARWITISVPLLWFTLFLGLPLLFILKMSFAKSIVAIPPFTPLLTLADATVQITLYLKNFQAILGHLTFLGIFAHSLKVALVTTFLCILIGYPIAYALSQTTEKWRNLLFMLVILPYWTSFLLRAYAWITLLQNNGFINQALQALHITHQPIQLLYNDFSVYVGLVYGYLPFFIMPLYSNLVKLNPSLIEAANDLGARPSLTFFRIVLPLTLPGLLAGSLFVFIPCVGEVVIPQLLGGINTPMIGNIIWQVFFIGNNWGLAAALSIVMLIILVGPIVFLQHLEREHKEAKL